MDLEVVFTSSWQWDQKDNNHQQVPAGTYTIELETMDAGTYSASFEIGLRQADLFVESLSILKAQLQDEPQKVTYKVKFGLTIQNQGGPAEPFTALFTLIRSGFPPIPSVSTLEFPALATGEKKTVEVEAVLDEAVEYLVIIEADTTDNVKESNEENNRALFKVLCKEGSCNVNR
jgi:hypothetical protein